MLSNLRATKASQILYLATRCMKHALLIPLFAATAFVAHAQKITVTGRVLSTSGEAQPGATVLERGTTNGTSTGANGEFSLNVESTATLTISAIGFATQTISVQGRQRFDVRLVASATDLSDVVVTGSRATEGRSNILTTAPVDVMISRAPNRASRSSSTSVPPRAGS